MIDLACGTGDLSCKYLTCFKSIHFLDVVEDHNDIIKKTLKKTDPNRDLSKDYKFFCEDLSNWKPSQKYDMIFGSYALANVEDAKVIPLIERAWNCLKPGGVLFFKEAIGDKKVHLTHVVRELSDLEIIFKDYKPSLCDHLFTYETYHSEALVICKKPGKTTTGVSQQKVD